MTVVCVAGGARYPNRSSRGSDGVPQPARGAAAQHRHREDDYPLLLSGHDRGHQQDPGLHEPGSAEVGAMLRCAHGDPVVILRLKLVINVYITDIFNKDKFIYFIDSFIYLHP